MARKKKEEVKEEEVKATAKGKGKGKKAKEETPVEEPKAKKGAKGKGKGKKAAEKATVGGGKRGRKAGVRNVLSKKDVAKIQDEFTALEQIFDEFADNVNDVVEKNSKSAIANARKNIQSLIKAGKPFRATLQSAKLDMVAEKV